MKRFLCVAAICAGIVALTAACSKTNDPPPPLPAPQKSSAQEYTPAPVTQPPVLPDPVVPKRAEAPSPSPGQANDHSSPAFKSGGTADPNK